MLKIRYVLRLLLVLSLVALVMFWVSISSSLKDRHQYFKNLYRQTYLQKGPIDVIASGSSRAIALAGAVELKSSLDKKHQSDDIIVYNYGKAGRDLVIDYVYLKDYLREHCVGTVLVEVNRAHVKDRYHMHFEHIAPYSVIWDSYLNDSYHGWPRRLQLGLRASINKMLKSVYRRYSHEFDEFDIPVEPVRTKYRRAKADQPVLNPKQRPADKNYWDLTAPFEYRQTRYIYKILEEAKKYGTKIIFYYAPTSDSSPLSPKLTDSFQQMFGQPLHQLNQKQLDDMRSIRVFGDYNHVNQNGRDYLVNWMVDSFDIQLSDKSKCAVR